MSQPASSTTSALDWSTLIRPFADSSAPNAPPHLTYTLINYTAYLIYLILIPIYVPYLVIVHYITRRPFDSWTLTKRLNTRLGKLQVYLIAWWIPPPPSGWDDWSIPPSSDHGTGSGDLYLSGQRKGEVEMKVVRLRALDKESGYVRGFADVRGQTVTSEVRPGFWISPKDSRGKGDEPAQKGERVILHIHGGGYIRGHPLWTPFPMGIAVLTRYRCLTVNYRKTLSPTTAFPAPLLDVLAAYIHLTRILKFEPADIIILAESAGAHLALILSQYLNDLKHTQSSQSTINPTHGGEKVMQDLGQPGWIVLSSPWTDFTLSQPSYEYNASYDQLVPLRLRRAVQSATRHYNPQARGNRYFSPCRAQLEDWKYLLGRPKWQDGGGGLADSGKGRQGGQGGTKVYVHYGGKELFRDEIVQLGQKMKEAGVNIRMREDLEGLHTSGMIASTEAGRIFRKDLLEMLDM
ncbi:hypothetical protein IAT40_007966 [Kwoniella sp. CBS 6097]